MRSIQEVLEEQFRLAIGKAFGSEFVMDPLIKAADARQGDYQCNVAMALAKKVGQAARPVAEKILGHLEVGEICEAPVVAGPGFINLRLKNEWVARMLREEFSGGDGELFRGGVPRVKMPETIVVDYSGPNVAKQMHVGHLRSTVIGDALARVLEFVGHKVVRQNHIGDFGTQFGMIIHYMRINKLEDKKLGIEELDAYYKAATEQFRSNAAFAAEARKTVVELQSGGAAAVGLWKRMREETRRHYMEIYRILGVGLNESHERGESFYGERLGPLVQRVQETLVVGGEAPWVGLGPELGASHDLPMDADNLPAEDQLEMEGAVAANNGPERVTESRGKWVVKRPFATVSRGAVCVFLPGYMDREKNPQPLMLQKSDGGFPYSATDLAALYFRVREEKAGAEEQKPLRENWHAQRVICLVDKRQSQHFSMVFDTFRAAQWDIHPVTRQPVQLEHAPFGTMLGENGRPFKTRTGGAAQLKLLIEEAIAKAAEVVREKNPEMALEVQPRVAEAVGVAAIKYADLKQDRLTDYVFSLERMVQPIGNTGPYLQYAYARIQNIFKKAGVNAQEFRKNGPDMLLREPEEAALGKKLLQFGGAVESVARDLKPHHLCNYLYELASAFSAFYEKCPVIQAEDAQARDSRLLLCDLVGRTLKTGLSDLLGIPTLQEM